MTKTLIFCLAITIALCPTAEANTEHCQTSINGSLIQKTYSTDDDLLYENMTFREIFFDHWGDISCPAYITLQHLTPGLSDKERGAFCLIYDIERKTYIGFDQGRRDAYLKCKEPSKSICERVNNSKDAALAIAGLGAGASGGAAAAASAAGVTAVTHSSGAVILTGASGYIAGTLGTIGASVVAVLTAPATLIAAGVSVVAVGGAVYVCKPPE